MCVHHIVSTGVCVYVCVCGCACVRVCNILLALVVVNRVLGLQAQARRCWQRLWQVKLMSPSSTGNQPVPDCLASVVCCMRAMMLPDVYWAMAVPMCTLCEPTVPPCTRIEYKMSCAHQKFTCVLMRISSACRVCDRCAAAVTLHWEVVSTCCTGSMHVVNTEALAHLHASTSLTPDRSAHPQTSPDWTPKLLYRKFYYKADIST